MLPVVSALLACLAAWFRSRHSMQLEILALRHQLAVYQQSVPRPRIRADRPPVVGLACPSVVRVAGRACLCPTPHRDRLAEEAIPRALEAFKSRQHVWSAHHCQGG